MRMKKPEKEQSLSMPKITVYQPACAEGYAAQDSYMSLLEEIHESLAHVNFWGAR